SPFDARLVDIKFFNSIGSDISVSQEKAIEQLFQREDFKRANMDEVGEISAPPRAADFYKTGYLKAINVETISHSKLKIVIDYACSSASMVFPSILGMLGADIVALNAYTSTNKITKTLEEFNRSLSQMSDIVTTLKADAGFLIDAGAEKVFLSDEKGKILPDDLAMLAVSYLVMKTYKKGVIAVPVNASSVIDELAGKFEIEVKRTALSARNIMAATKDENVIFVADGKGGFIFPEFQNSFDAMYAIGKIMEMLASLNVSLSEIAGEIPHFEVLHKSVACLWDKKGQTMRKAIEDSKNKTTQLIDGVKIQYAKYWVLLTPDSDDAFFHIWTEAKDKTIAQGYIDLYAEKIRQWQE
ncbi:MAG: nucleotidyltransferase, partial [Elusimicrobia bacterium]|nr:nucleotidyltransferase [Elusimicrobiota bacterium]